MRGANVYVLLPAACCLDQRNRRARNRADQSLALLHSALPEMVNNHQSGYFQHLCCGIGDLLRCVEFYDFQKIYIILCKCLLGSWYCLRSIWEDCGLDKKKFCIVSRQKAIAFLPSVLSRQIVQQIKTFLSSKIPIRHPSVTMNIIFYKFLKWFLCV